MKRASGSSSSSSSGKRVRFADESVLLSDNLERRVPDSCDTVLHDGRDEVERELQESNLRESAVGDFANSSPSSHRWDVVAAAEFIRKLCLFISLFNDLVTLVAPPPHPQPQVSPLHDVGWMSNSSSASSQLWNEIVDELPRLAAPPPPPVSPLPSEVRVSGSGPVRHTAPSITPFTARLAAAAATPAAAPAASPALPQWRPRTASPPATVKVEVRATGAVARRELSPRPGCSQWRDDAPPHRPATQPCKSGAPRPSPQPASPTGLSDLPFSGRFLQRTVAINGGKLASLPTEVRVPGSGPVRHAAPTVSPLAARSAATAATLTASPALPQRRPWAALPPATLGAAVARHESSPWEGCWQWRDDAGQPYRRDAPRPSPQTASKIYSSDPLLSGRSTHRPV